MEERYRLAYHAFTHRDYNILCLLLFPLLETQRLKEHTRELIQTADTDTQRRFIHFFSEATPTSIQTLLSADASLESNGPLIKILNAIKSASEETVSEILMNLLIPVIPEIPRSLLPLEQSTSKIEAPCSVSKQTNQSIAVLAEVSGLTPEKTIEWIQLILKHKVSLTENHKNLNLENFVLEVKTFKNPTDFWDMANLFSQKCQVDQVLQACIGDGKTVIYFGNAAAHADLLTPAAFQDFLSHLLTGKTFIKSFPTVPKKSETKGIIPDAVQNVDQLLSQLQQAILGSDMLSLLTEKSKKSLSFRISSHPYHGRAQQAPIVAHSTTVIVEDPSSSSVAYEDEDTSEASLSERRPSVMCQDRPRFQIRIQITSPILAMTTQDQEASFSQEEDVDIKIFMKNPDTGRMVNCQLSLTKPQELQTFSNAKEIADYLKNLLIKKWGKETAFIIKIFSETTEAHYWVKSQLETSTSDLTLTHLPFLEALNYGANTEHLGDIQLMASAAFTLFDMNGNSALVLSPYYALLSSLAASSQTGAQTLPPPSQSSSPLLQALEVESAALKAQSARKSAQSKALEDQYLSQQAQTKSLLSTTTTPPSSAPKPRALFDSPAMLAAKQDQEAIRKRLAMTHSHQTPISTPRAASSEARRILTESPTSSSKPSSPAELAAKIHQCRTESTRQTRAIHEIRKNTLSPSALSCSPESIFHQSVTSPPRAISPSTSKQGSPALNPNEDLLGGSPSTIPSAKT